MDAPIILNFYRWWSVYCAWFASVSTIRCILYESS